MLTLLLKTIIIVCHHRMICPLGLKYPTIYGVLGSALEHGWCVCSGIMSLCEYTAELLRKHDQGAKGTEVQ